MYLNLIVTEDNRDKNRKPQKESPKEDQIKDVENKERKNPQAKKETDPGKFQHSNITFIKILQWKLRWILFPTRTKTTTTTLTHNYKESKVTIFIYDQKPCLTLFNHYV